MAFLRFSRDKRGYENFSLLQPSVRGKSRPRLLYWFRTPPNVRVGRSPFDPEVRRALEAQNPQVTFDWTAIVETPIPPVDTERWRERRRVERAMRAASEAERTLDGAEPEGEGAEPEELVEVEAAPPVIETVLLTIPPVELESNATDDPASASNLSLPTPDLARSGHARHRRRRRRGRRKTQASGSGFQVAASSFEVPGAESSAGSENAQGNDPPENDSDADEES